jgi:hypothetical protein
MIQGVDQKDPTTQCTMQHPPPPTHPPPHTHTKKKENEDHITSADALLHRTLGDGEDEAEEDQA